MRLTKTFFFDFHYCLEATSDSFLRCGEHRELFVHFLMNIYGVGHHFDNSESLCSHLYSPRHLRYALLLCHHDCRLCFCFQVIFLSLSTWTRLNHERGELCLLSCLVTQGRVALQNITRNSTHCCLTFLMKTRNPSPKPKSSLDAHTTASSSCAIKSPSAKSLKRLSANGCS